MAVTQGRHRVYILFWPWKYEPFYCEADIITMSLSKSVSQGQNLRFNLFPHAVNARRRGDTAIRQYRYMDVLRPNDWAFVFVDPGDGGEPDPLFLGFIDSIGRPRSVGADGTRNLYIEVSCSGWEKAIRQVSAITSPFVSNSINIATLLALGPYGWFSESDSPLRHRLREHPWSSNSRLDRNVVESNLGPGSCKLPALIEVLVYIYLHTQQSMGRRLSDAAVGSAIDYSSSTDEDRLNEWARNVSTPSYLREDGRQEEVNALFNGQFELPGTNRPLWDFIKMKFQDLQQKAFVDVNMFLNGTTKSLASLIDEIANPVMNEVFYDVRNTQNDGLSSMDNILQRDITGGYSEESMRDFVTVAGQANESFSNLVEHIAPYMILRVRPLFPNEIMELDGPTVNEGETISYSPVRSDADLHNMTALDFPAVSMQLIRAQGGFAGFTQYRDRSLESIRVNGLRFYQEQCSSWPCLSNGVEIEAPVPSPDLGREWEIRLTAAGLDNVKVLSGSVGFPKYMRDLHIGGKLRIVPDQLSAVFESDPPERVYYVDGISYNYEAASGRLTTSVDISRGYSLDNESGIYPTLPDGAA